MQALIFLKDTEGAYVSRATVDGVFGVSCARAVWNTDIPDQHGTDMLWELTPERHIVLSRLGTLLVDSARYSIRAFDYAEGFVYLDTLEPSEMPGRGPLFALGNVVGTPDALAALEASGEAPTGFLDRHMCGDWGLICADDGQANYRAIKDGNRILSVYATSKGVKFWIITDANRATTTLLLPNDY
jgi:hypothetical protein